MENPLTYQTKGPPRLTPGQRVYVVGDVHGHREKLAAIHAQIRDDLHRRPITAPLLVHLGDLIDRGPDTAGCIELLAAGPPLRGVPTINLTGNHERLMLRAITTESHDDVDRWLDNGGAESLASWGLRSTTHPKEWLAGIPPRHLVFLRDLRQTYVLGGYVFVHAGVRPGIRLDQQRVADLLWIRDPFLKWDGVMLPETPTSLIVHGHTPSPDPVVKDNRIGLDTGAGKGRSLTCAILEASEIRTFQA